MHPNGQHLLYPLGSTVVIKDIQSGKQFFLRGHTDDITCVALSKDGSIVASGQKTHMGFTASIILWDFAKSVEEEGTVKIGQLPDMHKGKVQSLDFSPSGTYLASLGGKDDNTLVMWNVAKRKALNFAPAFSDSGLCVKFFQGSDTQLVTGGFYHVIRWRFEKSTLCPTPANLGKLRRIVTCLAIDNEDKYLFAGTHSGDLLKIDLEPTIPNFRSAGHEMFGKGILSVRYMVNDREENEVILGNGDGSIVRLCAKSLKVKKGGRAKVSGGVTGLALIRGNQSEKVNTAYVGTDESNIYFASNLLELTSNNLILRASCHQYGLNDVAYLADFDAVFITSSKHDLRVWNAKQQQELLRIQVPNVECTCLTLPSNGSLILTGWDDGKIRAFKPVSGELAFVMNDAHPKGVTALSVTNDCKRIVSGGKAGQVRFWSLLNRQMQVSLKEHKGPVSSISIRADDKECVSSSDDGSCISWDLVRGVRLQAVFASTMFKCMLYHPDESQLLSCGSDRKITYWDASDGSTIRIIEGSHFEINALDISKDGEKFVSSGNDSLIKLFDYDQGEVEYVGEGHSGTVKAVKFSPDQKQIVSVGTEGAIFVWKNPYYSTGKNGDVSNLRPSEEKYDVDFEQKE